MHAVARLVFHGLIDNIQTSWVKMGAAGVEACLSAGANDLGGTLMNESITRAAGASHGQEWGPAVMEERIRRCGREPWMRDTLYRPVSEQRRSAAFAAGPLAALHSADAGRQQRSKRLREVVPGVRLGILLRLVHEDATARAAIAAMCNHFEVSDEASTSGK